jgi:hypothetical protein
MTSRNPDEIAKLAYAFAKDMSAKDAREAVAGLFEMTPDEATRAIARGRELARREGKAA